MAATWARIGDHAGIRYHKMCKKRPFPSLAQINIHYLGGGVAPPAPEAAMELPSPEPSAKAVPSAPAAAAASSPTEPAAAMDMDDDADGEDAAEEDFEVAKIVDRRKSNKRGANGRIEFRVRWKGYAEVRFKDCGKHFDCCCIFGSVLKTQFLARLVLLQFWVNFGLSFDPIR